MGRWKPKEGSPEYEQAVKSMMAVLRLANFRASMNTKTHGLFAGQIGKKKREKEAASQEKQRV